MPEKIGGRGVRRERKGKTGLEGREGGEHIAIRAAGPGLATDIILMKGKASIGGHRDLHIFGKKGGRRRLHNANSRTA